ncbi:hypothetical protein ACJX0J_015750, partial [Zea mays]
KKNELSSEKYALIVEFETELDEIFCFCDEFKTPANDIKGESDQYAIANEVLKDEANLDAFAWLPDIKERMGFVLRTWNVKFGFPLQKKNELSSEKYTLIVEFETELDEIFCFCDEFKTPAVMACRTMSPTKHSSNNKGSIQPFARQTRRRSSEVGTPESSHRMTHSSAMKYLRQNDIKGDSDQCAIANEVLKDEANLDAFAWLPDIKERMSFVLQTWNVKFGFPLQKKNQLSSEKYALIVEFETELDEIFCFCDEFKTPAVMACRTMSPTKRISNNTGSIQPFTRQTRRRCSEVGTPESSHRMTHSSAMKYFRQNYFKGDSDQYAIANEVLKDEANFDASAWLPDIKERMGFVLRTWNIKFGFQLQKKNELSSEKYALIVEFETELDEIFCFCDEFKTPAVMACRTMSPTKCSSSNTGSIQPFTRQTQRRSSEVGTPESSHRMTHSSAMKYLRQNDIKGDSHQCAIANEVLKDEANLDAFAWLPDIKERMSFVLQTWNVK